jgi:hypothetical protein
LLDEREYSIEGESESDNHERAAEHLVITLKWEAAEDVDSESTETDIRRKCGCGNHLKSCGPKPSDEQG